jgi:hypothetical protein
MLTDVTRIQMVLNRSWNCFFCLCYSQSIAKLMDAQLIQGQTWYLISYRWWQMWKEYVNWDNPSANAITPSGAMSPVAAAATTTGTDEKATVNGGGEEKKEIASASSSHTLPAAALSTVNNSDEKKETKEAIPPTPLLRREGSVSDPVSSLRPVSIDNSELQGEQVPFIVQWLRLWFV